jgi:hypothetical protein
MRHAWIACHACHACLELSKENGASRLLLLVTVVATYSKQGVGSVGGGSSLLRACLPLLEVGRATTTFWFTT